MKIIRTLLLSALFLTTLNVLAQCDSTVTACSSYLSEEYISDGQSYRALLIEDQTAEFKTTLFGGNTYRIAACSGDKSGNLIIRLIDQEGNVLFTNKDYSNAPYWDFVVDSTIDCSIEAQLDEYRLTSGCAIIQIGFKR